MKRATGFQLAACSLLLFAVLGAVLFAQEPPEPSYYLFFTVCTNVAPAKEAAVRTAWMDAMANLPECKTFDVRWQPFSTTDRGGSKMTPEQLKKAGYYGGSSGSAWSVNPVPVSKIPAVMSAFLAAMNKPALVADPADSMTRDAGFGIVLQTQLPTRDGRIKRMPATSTVPAQ